MYFSVTRNTKKVAQKIAENLKSDILEIEPKHEYTSDDIDYSNDNCRANKEMKDKKARPEIANDLSRVDSCDKVYIRYPVWWGTAPRIIQTFIENYNLEGKKIYTFCTSGGSGVEQSISDLKGYFPKLDIANGYRFDSDASEGNISKGLEQLNNDGMAELWKQ